MARPTIPSYFSQVERELGLPAGFLTGSYGIESNFGANAGTSSAGAYGPFQFIPATAASYGLKDRGDLEASARAAAAYAADNARLLTQALGRPPTAGELYLAHQQGSEGALALLLNPDVPAYKAVGSVARIRQNLPKSLQGRAKTMTAREFFDHWNGEFQNRVKMASPASDYDPLTGTMRPQQVAADQYDRAFFGAMPYTDAVAAPRNEALAQIQQLVHPAAAAPPAGDIPQISPFTRGQIVDPYGQVPEYGNKGELQRPMFRQWNADPIGNSKALESGVSPALQQVIDRARQIAGPTLQFTVGSGKRTPQQQALAAQFGWSRVSKGGTHEDARAVDLWPVVNGQVVFDTDRMNKIGDAMTQASQELGIPMTWGKNFKSGPDIPHFEVGAGVEPKDPFGVVAAKAAGALPSLAPPGSNVPLPRPRPTPEPVQLAATGIVGQPAGVAVSGQIPLSAPAAVQMPRRPTNGMTMVGSPPGLLEPGNIDLTSRPLVKLPDGSTATVRSMSFGQDGREILVPTISPSGVPLSDEGAMALYNATGKNLGIFDSPKAADAYAQTLHNQQQQYYGLGTSAPKEQAAPVYQQPSTSGISFAAPQFVAGGASVAPTRIAAPPAPKSPVAAPASVAGVSFGKGYEVPATPSAVQYAVQSLGNISDAAPAMMAAPKSLMTAGAAAPVRKVQIAPPSVAYTPPTTAPAPYRVAGPRVGMFGALGNVISRVFNPNTVGKAIAYPAVSYAKNPAAQAYLANFGGGSAFTPAGFSAPNYSPGSGGSTFAYHSNGDGTGTYVNSQGRTIAYNANG